MSPRKRELARADRVQPGVWRLRLPLPWPGVPHVNAYAIAAGSGVVLVDTGMHEPGSLAQLELALDQAGLRWSTCGCWCAPTRTPTTTAWPGRSSRRPAASCGCTPTTST